MHLTSFHYNDLFSLLINIFEIKRMPVNLSRTLVCSPLSILTAAVGTSVLTLIIIDMTSLIATVNLGWFRTFGVADIAKLLNQAVVSGKFALKGRHYGIWREFNHLY